MGMETLKVIIKPYLESNIHINYLLIRLVRRLRFLLPHDVDFLGIPHLIGNGNGKLFIDVGANSGLSALSAFKLCPDIDVLSFEPNPIHLKSLEQIERWYPRFAFEMVGLGDQADANARIYVPKYRNVFLHGIATTNEGLLRKRLEQQFPKKILREVHITGYDMSIGTLDARLKTRNLLKSPPPTPAFIKIDTEGHELNVLKGARETLITHRPYLLLEKDEFQDTVLRFLEEISYVPCYYNHRRRCFERISSGQRNFFAIPSEKLSNIRMA